MIGGYIIPKQYIPIYLLYTPYLIIDWNDTDRSCWLTKLRNMIKYNHLIQRLKMKLKIIF